MARGRAPKEACDCCDDGGSLLLLKSQQSHASLGAFLGERDEYLEKHR